MNEFLFSICIPVYNTEKFLPRALDSITHQTFDTSKIEVVLVNDASPNTEECNKVIQEYSGLLSIQYIKKEQNQGLLSARKTAVEAANGEYILFLDADDSFSVYTFDILSRFIIDNPDYIQFQMYSIVGNDKLLFSSILEDEKNKTIEDVLLNRSIHNLVNKCYNSSLLKKIYSNIAHFYAVYAEDYYQSALIEYYSHKKIFIDIPFYNYFRDIGVTSDSTFQNKEKALRVLESFKNIKENLILFFEEKGEIAYAECVSEYIKTLHINFSYWTSSIYVLLMIIKLFPDEYRTLRLQILSFFFINKIKKFLKYLLPYGILRLLHKVE